LSEHREDRINISEPALNFGVGKSLNNEKKAAHMSSFFYEKEIFYATS
jgi:hypothetical protein